MVTAMRAQTIATSAICRAEIRYGQALMAANDKRHKPINLMLLELPALGWTADAADRYGEIRAQLRQQGRTVRRDGHDDRGAHVGQQAHAGDTQHAAL